MLCNSQFCRYSRFPPAQVHALDTDSTQEKVCGSHVWVPIWHLPHLTVDSDDRLHHHVLLDGVDEVAEHRVLTPVVARRCPPVGNAQSLQGRVARFAVRKQLLPGWYLDGSKLVRALHPCCSSNALTLVQRCNVLRQFWLHRQPLACSAAASLQVLEEKGLLCKHA